MIASGETREPARKAINPIAESNDEGGYDKGSDNYDIEENDQNLLIPLQKDFAATEGSFKVARTADKDQIAMVSGSTPISSMINKDNAADGIVRREPKAEEQQPGKNWESMAEKSGSDNPWVAAKGTKFPKTTPFWTPNITKTQIRLRLKPLKARPKTAKASNWPPTWCRIF